MVEALRKAAITNVLVVGGSPGTRLELQYLAGDEIELSTIDGTVRRTQKQARQDIAWADLVIIWGSTELAHKVSKLYDPARCKGKRRILVVRRGVSALAAAVIWHLGKHN